eukprot:5574457-Amphidinium_carterae.1
MSWGQRPDVLRRASAARACHSVQTQETISHTQLLQDVGVFEHLDVLVCPRPVQVLIPVVLDDSVLAQLHQER